MDPTNQELQLELFDLARQREGRPHREMLGRLILQVRYDQCVLAGIAGLIGLTVVFACGVERGKQLVRFERAMLVHQQPASEGPRQADEASEPPAARQPGAGTEASPEPQTKSLQRLAPAQKVKVPSKLASGASAPSSKRGTAVAATPAQGSTATAGKSRFAIQVVAYRRLPQARRELELLQARGERAFLVMRDGRTIVYVGPFPSKGNAAEKLTALKARYQDCFVKTL